VRSGKDGGVLASPGLEIGGKVRGGNLNTFKRLVALITSPDLARNITVLNKPHQRHLVQPQQQPPLHPTSVDIESLDASVTNLKVTSTSGLL
jgi:hypothetical protein